MTDFPDLKIKMVPAFPSNVIGGVGLEATRVNGHVTLDYAWQEFGAVSAIPTSPTSYILTYDTQNDAYVMVPSHLLGGAVAGISDAPNDGTQYGRQSGGWTPIIGGGGGTPAVAPPLMDGTAAVGTSLLYARQDHVHPTDTSRAPINSPAFTGVPTTATTPTAGDSSLKLATTAFVQAAVSTGSVTFDALSPTTTQGDIIYRNASTNTRLGAGPNGYHLQTAGAGVNPSWSGFTQAGAGAVVRAWQDKSRDVIHASDFGVTANGTTDDTAAMNAALAAAAGKKLVVPAGLILISNSLNPITAGSTYIEGAGADSTKFVISHGFVDIFTWTNVVGGGMRGCGFNASVTRGDGSYIKINNSNLMWFCENNFNGAYIGITISANGGRHIWIMNSQFTLAPSGTGVYLINQTGNINIINNSFIGTLEFSPIAAIKITDASGIWMYGNDCYQCGCGLLIEPSFGNKVENVFGVGNAWDSSQKHGVFINNNGGAVQRLRFSNEWCATNNLFGILIQGTGTTSGISWVNGYIINNGHQGLGCAMGSNYDFSHNTVAGNGYTAPGTMDGLSFQPGISDVRLIGNRCGPVDGYANTQQFGIGIESGPGNNIQILNNDLSGNAAGSLKYSAVTGTSNRVEGNIAYNPVGMSNYTPPASGTTYRAGPTRETHYLDHGNLTNLTVNGVGLFYGSGNSTVTFDLGPNETYLMIYSSPPTCARTIH